MPPETQKRSDNQSFTELDNSALCIHQVSLTDIGLVGSSHKRKRSLRTRSAPAPQPPLGKSDDSGAEDEESLLALGLPVRFGAGGSQPRQPKTASPTAQNTADFQAFQQGGCPSQDWQQAYDAATGHFYYFCEQTRQTQWEPPTGGFLPARIEWLPDWVQAEEAQACAAGGSHATSASLPPASQSSPAPEPASPYVRAICAYKRWHEWPDAGPRSEDTDWGRSGKVTALAPKNHPAAADVPAESRPTAGAPRPRMESTGMMPRLLESQGQHLRFDDDDAASGSSSSAAGAEAPQVDGSAKRDDDVDAHADGGAVWTPTASPADNVKAQDDKLFDEGLPSGFGSGILPAVLGSEMHAPSPEQVQVSELQEDLEALEVGNTLYTMEELGTKTSKRRRRRKRQPKPAGGLPWDMQKYYLQRYSLFSRYDEGILLDVEGWYSATPEVVAWHHANRLVAAAGSSAKVAVDAFAGAGGNAIQLALAGCHVVAVEIDPDRASMLAQNAAVYGVRHRIEVICADFLEIGPFLRADVAFFSPPWGGPSYASTDVVQEFDVEDMGGRPEFGLTRLLDIAFDNMGCTATAVWLPRHASLMQVNEAVKGGRGASQRCEIERAILNGRLKGVTAYFGAAAKCSTKIK